MRVAKGDKIVTADISSELAESLARLKRTVAAREARQAQGQQEPKPCPTAKVLQFPLPFGEATRAAANYMLRCALFAAVKERRHFTSYVVIGQFPDMLIEFIGEQFNQDDHDTLMQLIKMALHREFGIDIVQAVNAVLRGIGRSTHQEQRRQLFEQVSRLVRGTIRVTMGGQSRYEGHIIDDACTPQDQETLPRFRRHIAYRLNPKFAAFYNANSYTLIDTQKRQLIKGRGSELGKWLHLLIESNAAFYPTKVETLHGRSGSSCKEMWKFRQLLRQALDLLKRAGVLHAWEIDPASDLVTVARTPSQAQQKHIGRKQERAI